MDVRSLLDELEEIAAAAQESSEQLLEGARLVQPVDPVVAHAARRVAEHRRHEASRLREIRRWVAHTWSIEIDKQLELERPARADAGYFESLP